MRRVVLPLLGLGCLVALTFAVNRPVLFEGGQFAGGNASYYFYPLYQRVQQEWEAGRWPLWDPGHNGGQPLLGNPIAAVLYPGKLVYAFVPYAWGARLYVIAHQVLAVLGGVALGRSIGASWTGSFLGGLSYGFGGPILHQYCNLNYLVGAAWVPWGLRAIDRLVRQGRPRACISLALVLTMQVLGGDPEAAYLTAVSGAGYAVILAIRWRVGSGRPYVWAVILAALGLWVACTLTFAAAAPTSAGVRLPRGLVVAGWLVVGVVLLWWWRRHSETARLAPMLARLGGACALAGALAAAQILPSAEFLAQSWRAEGMTSTNIYRYSVEPCRAAELIWPNVFGTSSSASGSWINALPPAGDHQLWVDSLYLGGLPLALALVALGVRGQPWRAWLAAVAVLGLAASLGKYGSPLWWARSGPLASFVGPHDPPFGQPRFDRFLSDGAGSPYAILSSLLPGFGSFRFPSKLLPLAMAALTALAGAGWDDVTAGRGERRLLRLALAGLSSSLLGLVLALTFKGRAVAWLTSRLPADALFGPVDVPAAWTGTQWALAHGALIFAATVVVARLGPRRPILCGAGALLLLTLDLTLANARLIETVSQAELETPPEALRLIEAAERSDPSPGPFRIHRMPGWFPRRFATARDPQRSRDLYAWSRDTLSPLIALPYRLNYCTTSGSLELEEDLELFRPRMIPLVAEMARTLGVPAGQPVVYYPRRSFDLWGTRYFLLPASPDWKSPSRGFISFLDQTDLIYPSLEVVQERGEEGQDSWSTREDWQLRRNKAVFPRAWIVHRARILPPAVTPEVRASIIRTLTFVNDPIWKEADRRVFDPREAALIETEDGAALGAQLIGSSAESGGSVQVVSDAPGRVELRATLNGPGLVILADTLYPGWRLTIDGQPAPILRANRLMRGAAVPGGAHTLVYSYLPWSFLVGSVISSVGLLVLVGAALVPRATQPHEAVRTGSPP